MREIKRGKSKWQKGADWELLYSKDFHQVGWPLLISPLVLRSRGGGQVDVARIEMRGNERCLCLVELKAGFSVSPGQKERLRKSAIFLAHLFGYPIEQKYEMLEEGDGP